MAKKSTRSTPSPGTDTPAAPKPRARAKSSAPRTRKAAAADKSVTSRPGDDTVVVIEETTVVIVNEPTDEEIRVRAYHRFLERGASHGSEFDDWVEARRDLLKSR